MRQEKRRRSGLVAILLVVQGWCVAGVLLGLGIAFLGQPHVDNHGWLELTAARSAQMKFLISADASINGLWQAPGGIQVELRNDALYYSQYVEVMKSSNLALHYEAPLVNDRRLDATTIPIDLTLPTDIPGPATQTLRGEITNYIFLPVPAGSGGHEIVRRELAVSLTIHLAPVEPKLDYIRYHPEPLRFGLVALATLVFLADTVLGAEVWYWWGIRDVAALTAAADTKRLLRALRHKDAAVRREAALALGELHSYPALAPLMDAVHDPDSDVRLAAARAGGDRGLACASATLVDCRQRQ